jgi:hypothetical protein
MDHELVHIHMAHLPKYYHKAAALMGVHQSYELAFFYSILRSRWTSRHVGEDFVKFGELRQAGKKFRKSFYILATR